MRSLPPIRWLWLGLAAVIIGSAAMATNAKDRDAKLEAERIAQNTGRVTTVTVTTPGGTTTGTSNEPKPDSNRPDRDREKGDREKPAKQPSATPIVGSRSAPRPIAPVDEPVGDAVGTLTPQPPVDGATLLPSTDPPVGKPPVDATSAPPVSGPGTSSEGTGTTRTGESSEPESGHPGKHLGWAKKKKKVKRGKPEHPHGGARAFGHEDD